MATTHVNLYRTHYTVLKKTLTGLPVGDRQAFRYYSVLLYLQSVGLVQQTPLAAIVVWCATQDGKDVMSAYQARKNEMRNALIAGIGIALFTYALSNGTKIIEWLAKILEIGMALLEKVVLFLN